MKYGPQSFKHLQIGFKLAWWWKYLFRQWLRVQGETILGCTRRKSNLILWSTPSDPVSPRDGYGGLLFGFNHFHTEALNPGGTCVVFVLSGRWHPNCYIAANFWLHCNAYKCSFWHRCHREDTSIRRAKWEFLTFQYHLQIALSSHKNRKEKNNTFFF